MQGVPQATQEVEWIRRVQGGEREAFGPLVELHERRVRSLVFHLLRRHDEVDDIAQEIFFKAFKGIGSYNFQSSFGTWLARIAVNHCYDYLRREQKARVSYYWPFSEESAETLEDLGRAEVPAWVREHVASCAACQAWARDWRLIRAGLRLLAREPVPGASPGFAARLARKLEGLAAEGARSGEFWERAGRQF